MSLWLLFIVVGGYVLYEIATEFKAAGVDSGWALENAAMFPRFLAVAMIAIAVLGSVMTMRDYRRGKDDTEHCDIAPFNGHCVVVLAVLLSYVLTLDVLGYYLASTVFMTLCLCILRDTTIATSIPVILSSSLLSLAVVIAFGWLFEGVLGFVLPLGVWQITLS